MEKLTKVVAIKKYFERQDSIAPNGGRKLEVSEMKGMSADLPELANLCAKELGVEIA